MSDGKASAAIEVVKRTPPALIPAALAIVAIVAVVWRGGEGMEKLAASYIEALRERDREFSQTLDKRDARFEHTLDAISADCREHSAELVERFERMQLDTNRVNTLNSVSIEKALERATQVIDANTAAFVEFNLLQRRANAGEQRQ